MRGILLISLCLLIAACSIKVETIQYLDRTEKLIEVDVIKYPVEGGD